MKMDRILRASLPGALLVLAAGCAPPRAPPATIDGWKPPAVFAGFMSPQMSRTGCIDAVSRYFKVPRQDAVPTSDQQTMEDGYYIVTMAVAGQPGPINCSVDENGIVSDVVRAPR